MAGLAAAFPSNMMMGREAMPDPSLLSGLDSSLLSSLGTALTPLANDVKGLLGSVASSVDPSNLRPEPGYVFQEPLSTDSRGPCPGLNLLANYGYLPRNGHVNAGQVIDAVARGFNMGADLAAVLVVFAVLADGDIPTESWYLGSGPGAVGGLNRHSTVEADISPNREDYYNGCGDNHHLSSRLFKRNVLYAAQDPQRQFTFQAMGKHYAAQASFAKKYNPQLYYFPFPMIVSFVAYNFYSAFFSNGTYGAGGVANYESISSIIGAKYDVKKDAFEYVPERWPAYWYRRAYEYDAVTALADGIAYIYDQNIVVPAVAQVGTQNLNATNVLCDIYQGINSITPLALASDLEATASAASWAIGLLDQHLDMTALGCSATSLSKNYLYPNATNPGGPAEPSPPASYVANSGNNTYHQIYFPPRRPPRCASTPLPLDGYMCRL